MALPVVIKGGKNYITLVLDSEMEFADLLKHIIEKFVESEKFFQSEPIAIMFSGRILSDSEQCIILDAIAEYTTIHVTNILDYSDYSSKAAEFLLEEQNPVEEVDISNDECLYFERNIVSGEKIEADKTVIIKGNVEIGAIVKTTKNIIVLGSLLGQAVAGLHEEDSHAYIIALDFEPENFRIGKSLGMSLKKRKYKTSLKNRVAKKAQRAYISDGIIQIEQLFK